MRDELLALLEEQPYRTDDLAGWLGQPSIAVAHTLRAMQRDGLVKKIGTIQRWALVSFVAVSGRKPLDRSACQRAILSALEGRALALHELVRATNYGRTLVKQELPALLVGGALQQSGRGRSSRWSLPGFEPPAPVRPPDQQPAAAVDQTLEDLEADEHELGDDLAPADDRDLTDEDADAAIAATVTRVGRPRRAVQTDGVVPWWMTDEAKRDFGAAARTRDAEMRTDKEWAKRTKREYGWPS